MTPQQDSLSGVIICLANWDRQQLRVNSFTTTNNLKISYCALLKLLGRVDANQQNVVPGHLKRLAVA